MEETGLVSLGLWAWFLAAAVLMILELAAAGRLPGLVRPRRGRDRPRRHRCSACPGSARCCFSPFWPSPSPSSAATSCAARPPSGPRQALPQSPAGCASSGATSSWPSRSSSGAGRVRVDDSIWRVVGPDLPAGTTVRVVSVDGVAPGRRAASDEPRRSSNAHHRARTSARAHRPRPARPAGSSRRGSSTVSRRRRRGPGHGGGSAARAGRAGPAAGGAPPSPRRGRGRAPRR